jgi:predicted DNA-binding antitoxin AbrB/MazE fold protein
MHEIEAVYENGALKLAQPLPLSEHERVLVTVKPLASKIAASAGLLTWTGDPDDLSHLLGPENSLWERS